MLDASGDDVAEGVTEAVPGDEAAMQRKLGRLPPGEYRVRWTTVSRIDSHTLKGEYTFAVGRSAEGAERLADSPLDSDGVPGLIGRFVGLAGLSLWAGMATLGHVALQAGISPAVLSRLGRWAPVSVLVGMGLAAFSAAFLLAAAGAGALVPWHRRLPRACWPDWRW